MIDRFCDRFRRWRARTQGGESTYGSKNINTPRNERERTRGQRTRKRKEKAAADEASALRRGDGLAMNNHPAIILRVVLRDLFEGDFLHGCWCCLCREKESGRCRGRPRNGRLCPGNDLGRRATTRLFGASQVPVVDIIDGARTTESSPSSSKALTVPKRVIF